MPKTALVIGATGLVGSTLVPLLLASPSYAKVVLLVRRPLPLAHAKLVQSVIDFDQPDASLVQGDDLFCAIGTTLKKAGSQAAQYQIDCTYPHELAKLAQANGCQQFILVSSIGADAQSGNFYLRTKGDLEQKIAALGFRAFISVRPSFILGNRQEFRLGEKIGIGLANLLAPLMVGGLRKYRGVSAEKIAKAMIALASQGYQGQVIVESDKLQAY
jgi:uncharacterized protein YbjT (DUF2867 family)